MKGRYGFLMILSLIIGMLSVFEAESLRQHTVLEYEDLREFIVLEGSVPATSEDKVIALLRDIPSEVWLPFFEERGIIIITNEALHHDALLYAGCFYTDRKGIPIIEVQMGYESYAFYHELGHFLIDYYKLAEDEEFTKLVKEYGSSILYMYLSNNKYFTDYQEFEAELIKLYLKEVLEQERYSEIYEYLHKIFNVRPVM